MRRKTELGLLAVLLIASLMVPACTCNVSDGNVYYDCYGNVVPCANSTYSLGSATTYWDNIYVNNIIGAGGGGTGNITGTGTANTMTKWTGVLSIGNASMTEAQAQDAVNRAHTQGTDTTLGALTANISANTQWINGLSDPTQAQDAATKAYVDAHSGTGNVTATDGVAGYIPFFTTAVNISRAITVFWDSLTGFLGIGTTTPSDELNLIGTANITGNIVVGGTVDGKDVSTLATAAESVAAAKADADISDAISKKHTQGTDTTLGTLTANITMGGFNINSLADPTQAQDAATKAYVDSLPSTDNITGFGTANTMAKWTDVDELGDASMTEAEAQDAVDKRHTQGTDTTLGTMTANITMGSFNINGLANPTQDQDADTKAARDTAISAHTDNPTAHQYSPYNPTAGDYTMGIGYANPNNAQQAMVADRLYATPIYLPVTMTFDRIAINVTTASGAGTKARLGIYSDDSNDPDSLILDAGEVAVDSTGVKAIVINQQLTAGIYYTAVVSDSTPTLARSTQNYWLFRGFSSSPYAMGGAYGAHVYAALPAAFPATTLWGSAIPYSIMLRVASVP